jgi:MFS family permease
VGLTASAFRPLRSRNFALVWAAALVSNIGTWMQTVAVGVLVTDLTGQARWTGLVAAAAFIPSGLLGPIGGAVADRLDRRRWLLLTTIGETALAVVLAVLAAAGEASPGMVTLVVFAGGCMASLGFPAYQAMLPDLVERDDLLGAISLGSAQYNFGRIIGPALAGALISLGSYSLAFAVNAVSFGAVVIALLLVRLPVRPAVESTARLWARIAEGARTAAAEPGCRAAITLIAVTALLVSPFIALVPAFAQVLLGGSEAATATLVTAQGIGAVAGALAQAPLADRFGRRRVLTADLLAAPCAVAVYALMPNVASAAVALMVVGAAYIGVLSGLNTVVQLRAPDGMRARVLSIYMLALGVVYPIGAVAQGALADRIGLRLVTAGGALLLLGLVLVLRWRRSPLLAALADQDGTVDLNAPGPVNTPGRQRDGVTTTARG